MLNRSVALAGLALGVLVIPMPRRATTTTKYRVEAKNETTVDLSLFGQPNQLVNYTLVSWIAVTLSDTVGGRVVHVRVDSMKYDGTTPQLSQAIADSAKGGSVHGLVDPNGRVKNLTTKPPQNVFLADLQGTVNALFPKGKMGAKLGESWTDTVEVTNTLNGANLKSNFVIAYTSGGPGMVGALPAMKVSATTTAGVSGTMENPQMGTMEVSGTIKGSSSFLVGQDGRFLGGNASSTTDQVVKSPMAPAPIPVKAVRAVTVTLLP